MKFEKAEVTRIEVSEDIIVTSGNTTNPASDCTNAGSKKAANCTSDTYVSYQTCASNALWHHS